MPDPNSAALTCIARCATCGDDLFTSAGCVAYRVVWVHPDEEWPQGGHALERVDIGNRRPWVGVRLICPGCLLFFRGNSQDSRGD